MKIDQRRRKLLLGGGLAGAAVLLPFPSAAADVFPSRPVKVLVGFPAGGSIDSIFRVIAQAAEQFLKQPIVVDNRPGAGGTISIVQMKNAPADGYTLGIITMGVFRAPVMEAVAYDPIRDISYIVCLTHVPFGVVVRADSPFRTWADLMAFGRSDAQRVNYGVAAGLGNSAHLLMEEITAQEQVKWNPIPYKGSADTAQALLAGDVTFTVDGSGGFGPLVDSGKARLLAVASEERSPKWPSVPTTKELGYRMTIDSPWGIGGPAGIDPSRQAVIETAFAKALDTASVKDALWRFGQGTRFKNSQDFAHFAVQAAEEERTLLTKYGFAKAK
jgi:tripartite-type tricarboxylate transporter receptor subunit TctC